MHNVQRYNIFCTFKIHFTINKIYIKYIEKLEEINLSTWINTFLLRFWTQDANVLVPSRYSLGWADNGAGDLPGGISPLCPYQALTNLFTPSFYFYIIFSNLFFHSDFTSVFGAFGPTTLDGSQHSCLKMFQSRWTMAGHMSPPIYCPKCSKINTVSE